MTDLRDLKRAVKPHLQVVKEEERTDVPTIGTRQAREGLVLGSRADKLLRSKSTNGDDRSARLYELASLLRDSGAEPEESFVLLRASIWNKFKGRDDEVQRLWEAVTRASAATVSERASSNGRSERVSKTSATRLGTLLAREVPASEWCVEGVWEHNGWGFIAGEPKTYKSTFASDLAISLATGTPFLGHFDVPKPGPVLIVQEENTENIQWARMSRILRQRGLAGKFHSFTDGILEMTPPSTDCPVYCLDRTRFSFTNKKKRRALEADIKAIQPVMVVLDPLQRMLGDLSIRSEHDVTQVLDWLDYVNKTYKTGLMLVHHYHKRREEGPMVGGQRMLGSQALHAWLSCGLYVQRVGAENGRLKVDREFRAFADGGPFELEFQSEDDQDFYHVEVFEKERKKVGDKLEDLVNDRPGISVKKAAEILEQDEKYIRNRARKLGLRASKRKTDSKGGRPSIGLYPSTNGKPKKVTEN
jgi:hypothetical protein